MWLKITGLRNAGLVEKCTDRYVKGHYTRAPGPSMPTSTDLGKTENVGGADCTSVINLLALNRAVFGDV